MDDSRIQHSTRYGSTKGTSSSSAGRQPSLVVLEPFGGWLPLFRVGFVLHKGILDFANLLCLTFDLLREADQITLLPLFGDDQMGH